MKHKVGDGLRINVIFISGRRSSILRNVFREEETYTRFVGRLSTSSATRTGTRWGSKVDIDVPIPAGRSCSRVCILHFRARY